MPPDSYVSLLRLATCLMKQTWWSYKNTPRVKMTSFSSITTNGEEQSPERILFITSMVSWATDIIDKVSITFTSDVPMSFGTRNRDEPHLEGDSWNWKNSASVLAVSVISLLCASKEDASHFERAQEVNKRPISFC